MVLLNGVSHDILRLLCQRLDLDELCRLFATHDAVLCKALTSARVIPKLAIERPCRSLFGHELVYYLRRHISLVEFGYSLHEIDLPAPIIFLLSRASLRSLSLNCAFVTLPHASFLSSSAGETFASLFPQLQSLSLIASQQTTASVDQPPPRDAFLVSLCSELPQGLHTLQIASIYAWPPLEALPQSLTSISVLVPGAMDEYAREARSFFANEDSSESNSRPAYDVLRLFDRRLSRLESLALIAPRASSTVFSDHIKPLLPNLRTLDIQPRSNAMEETQLIIASLPSVTDLSIQFLKTFTFGETSVTLDSRFVLPPLLTSLKIVASTSTGFNEQLFTAIPPSLETLSLTNVFPVFGKCQTLYNDSRGAPPPFFGGGAGHGAVGGFGFFQNPFAATPKAAAPQKSWDPSVHWMTILPSTIQRLVLLGTDFDLRYLPLSLEHFEAGRGDQGGWSEENLVFPPQLLLPPCLESLKIPLVSLVPNDINDLPSSLKHLSCRLTPDWNQHDIKHLLGTQFPALSLSSPERVAFTWNDQERMLAKSHMSEATLSSFADVFDFSALIKAWLGSSVYSRCNSVRWKASPPHSMSKQIEAELSSVDSSTPKPRLDSSSNSSDLEEDPFTSVSTLNGPSTSVFGSSSGLTFGTAFGASSPFGTGPSNGFSVASAPRTVIFGSPVTSAAPTAPSAPSPSSTPTDPPIEGSMDLTIEKKIVETLELPPTTSELHFGPEMEVSDACLAAHCRALPNLKVIEAYNAFSGFGNRPTFGMCSSLPSHLTTLHLYDASFHLVPFSTFPPTLTSIVSHARHVFRAQAPFGEFNKVVSLPRNLTRLDAPTILIGPQKTKHWPKGLTSLEFNPYTWTDVDVKQLWDALPFKKLHLDGRVAYTGELDEKIDMSLESSIMEVDASQTQRQSRKMKQNPVFALHSLLSRVQAALAPATIRNIDLRSANTYWSPDVESIELMQTSDLFSQSLDLKSWGPGSVIDGKPSYFVEFLQYKGSLRLAREHPDVGKISAADPSDGMPSSSPFATMRITFSPTEVGQLGYLTSLKLGTHPLPLAKIPLLPKNLATLAIVLDYSDANSYVPPNAEASLFNMESTDIFRLFPRGLHSLTVLSTKTLTLTVDGIADIPASLTELKIPLLEFSPLCIESWKTLSLISKFTFDGHHEWREPDIQKLGSVMCGGNFELLEVLRCVVSGSLLPRDLIHLSSDSLISLTKEAFSPNYVCHWRSLAMPMAPLPKTLQSLDLIAASISTFSRHILCLPQGLTSLRLRLDQPLDASDLLSLPQTLRSLRLFHDGITRAQLDSNFWVCLPPLLEELEVDYIMSKWDVPNSKPHAQSAPYPVTTATMGPPALLNINRVQKPKTMGFSWAVGPPTFEPEIIANIPYLSTDRLRSLILPTHTLGESCLNALGPSIQRLHVYQLENFGALDERLGRHIDFIHFSAIPVSPSVIQIAENGPRKGLNVVFPEESIVPTPGGGHVVGTLKFAAKKDLKELHITDSSNQATNPALGAQPLLTVTAYSWQ